MKVPSSLPQIGDPEEGGEGRTDGNEEKGGRWPWGREKSDEDIRSKRRREEGEDKEIVEGIRGQGGERERGQRVAGREAREEGETKRREVRKRGGGGGHFVSFLHQQDHFQPLISSILVKADGIAPPTIVPSCASPLVRPMLKTMMPSCGRDALVAGREDEEQEGRGSRKRRGRRQHEPEQQRGQRKP
eukprot:753961-Hanusia_phi.AAC.3